MITLEQAHKILKEIKLEPSIEEVYITDALGMVLAEDIYSDVDIPPFDKSAMDGYACKQADLSESLKVVDYIPAGSLPNVSINTGQCSKIMTGAKLPEGADCVIMVEHTKSINDDVIEFTGKGTKSNICKQGEDVKIGDKVLKKGSVLNPASIGVAASVGKTMLKVFKAPKVALIATGDELVDIDTIPEGANIRNSNSYNLFAQIGQTPALANYIGIVHDSKKELKETIAIALESNDILILTGGVSMGDKDYIPEIFEELGLELTFDKLAIQPGKPVAFAHGGGKYCFGLSGNPVSSLLQFELLAKPFIYFYMKQDYKLPFVKMKLSTEKKRKKIERMQFFPIQLNNGEASVLEFHGSAHLAGLTKANGFGIFEIGKEEIKIGEEINVLLI